MRWRGDLRLQPDIAAARSMLGWKPIVQLEDGVKETTAYFLCTLMLDINDFKDNLVAFESLRIRDARTIWLDDEATSDLENLLDKGLSKA